MPEHVLLTGATGYIGSHLLQKWLDASDATVSVLARPRREASPSQRIRSALAGLYGADELESKLDRVEVLEGDVAHDRIGLDEPTWQRLAANLTRVIHCAAAARFDLELDQARRINVGGTGHVIDLAKACTGLERMDYIGTAYVAGRRSGVVREEEPDAGQEHNNTYERSKLEAEKLVRAHRAELPITILRPSIVICDSRTGRVSPHNGFARALTMYASDLMRVLPGRPSSRMDLVPVDFVVEAAYDLAHLPDAVGRCYHLTAGVGGGTSLSEIRTLASERFAKRPFGVLSPSVFEGLLKLKRIVASDQQKKSVDEIRRYVPYILGELEFDNANLTRDTGLKAPPVREYFARMAGFIQGTTEGKAEIL